MKEKTGLNLGEKEKKGKLKLKEKEQIWYMLEGEDKKLRIWSKIPRLMDNIYRPKDWPLTDHIWSVRYLFREELSETNLLCQQNCFVYEPGSSCIRLNFPLNPVPALDPGPDPAVENGCGYGFNSLKNVFKKFLGHYAQIKIVI